MKQTSRKTIKSPALGSRHKFLIEQSMDDFLIPKLADVVPHPSGPLAHVTCVGGEGGVEVEGTIFGKDSEIKPPRSSYDSGVRPGEEFFCEASVFGDSLQERKPNNHLQFFI